eukprot:1808666-Alexandrium_andersonii.AAC.1
MCIRDSICVCALSSCRHLGGRCALLQVDRGVWAVAANLDLDLHTGWLAMRATGVLHQFAFAPHARQHAGCTCPCFHARFCMRGPRVQHNVQVVTSIGHSRMHLLVGHLACSH